MRGAWLACFPIERRNFAIRRKDDAARRSHFGWRFPPRLSGIYGQHTKPLPWGVTDKDPSYSLGRGGSFIVELEKDGRSTRYFVGRSGKIEELP